MRKATLALALAAPLLAPDARAQLALTETQRIEWSSSGSLPAGSHYGATVAIAETQQGLAVVGGPGSGALEFLSTDNAEGNWQSTAGFFGGPQPRALAADGPARLWTRVEANGTTSVLALSTLLLSHLDGGPIEAVVRDGSILAIGQPAFGGVGRVQIYEDGGSGFALQATFFGGTDDELGAALAIDGSVIAVGAPGDGLNGTVKVYVDTGSWIELQHIDSPAVSQVDARFGAALALQGDMLAIGSPDVDRTTTPGARTDVGAVYTYRVETVLFAFETLLRPASANEHFAHVGASVAMHDFGDGPVLALGAPGEDVDAVDQGAAHVYSYASAEKTWTHLGQFIDRNGSMGDGLGFALSLGQGGLLVGAPWVDGVEMDTGAALFFRHVRVLFADGFEAGSTAAWSAVVP